MKEKIVKPFQKAWAWWKPQRKRVKLGVILGVVIAGLIIKNILGPEDGVVLEQVKQQTLLRTVVASGTVVSATDLSLGFEVSDVVRDIRVIVGQKVKKGDILVTLNSSEERAAVTSARGALLSAEARYQKVLDGSSNEEIALAQVNLQNAVRDLAQTQRVQDTLVENARRKLFSDGLIAESTTGVTVTNTPTISGTYTGEQGEYTITISSIGSDFVAIGGIETGTAKISTTSAQPFGTKGLSLLFPPGSSSGQGGNWKVRIPNMTGASYVTNLNAYTQAKDARDAAVAAAEALVATRTAELNLKRATARQADVDAALADVISAQAGVESAQARLEKKILRAPADGTITRVDVKIGELTTPQKEIVVLQDVGNLYLEANVGEGNISTIALGQSVAVTYDAFPGTKYTATISSIDPAATQEGTIINYKIKALITEVDLIKPGMTANMAIVTAEKPGVLTIPARVITKREDGVSQVEKVVTTRGKRYKTQLVTVTTGLKGDGDMLEVTSGLSAGEQVIWRQSK